MSKRTDSEKKPPKQVITIYSPDYFGYKEIGTTLVYDPREAIGRTLWVSLYTITGDFTKQYLLIRFKIVRVKEDLTAETIFYGHEYGREFLRSLVRRGTSRIDGIFNLTTKDGFQIRVHVIAFTTKRLTPHCLKVKKIRKCMQKILEDTSKNLTLSQLAQEMVLGKTASDIFQEAKKITLLRHVGVVKSKVLRVPEWVYVEEAVREAVQTASTSTESQEKTS
ncbi:MAG: 30S ribosomal protein S3ae [Aigarchaeota archaeon]|nr:30S ribosomal protein S3ae [Aigarchaeota archaeon]MDW7985759.1 30S ribosomal protein S3ae [Nitrososphaerota archaeon]